MEQLKYEGIKFCYYPEKKQYKNTIIDYLWSYNLNIPEFHRPPNKYGQRRSLAIKWETPIFNKSQVQIKQYTLWLKSHAEEKQSMFSILKENYIYQNTYYFQILGLHTYCYFKFWPILALRAQLGSIPDPALNDS